MNFYKHYRSYPVGAQFIGAPPIYRPIVLRWASQADESVVGAINRPLQLSGLFRSSALFVQEPYMVGQMRLALACHAERLFVSF